MPNYSKLLFSDAQPVRNFQSESARNLGTDSHWEFIFPPKIFNDIIERFPVRVGTEMARNWARNM